MIVGVPHDKYAKSTKQDIRRTKYHGNDYFIKITSIIAYLCVVCVCVRMRGRLVGACVSAEIDRITHMLEVISTTCVSHLLNGRELDNFSQHCLLMYLMTYKLSRYRVAFKMTSVVSNASSVQFIFDSERTRCRSWKYNLWNS